MAFLQSSPPREPFLQAPASVLWLIGVLVAVHLVFAFGLGSDQLWASLAFIPARFEAGLSASALWPLVTHMFLHGGALHLIMNCLWLLAFGPLVARRYGAGWFLALFFGSGIAGALTHLAFHWGSMDAVIGASGGVSGLMGAGFRMIRWPGVETTKRLVPLFARPILTFSALWLVTNLIFGIVGFDGQIIAWEAHVGGYLCGLLAIGLVDRLRFGAYSAG